MEIFHFIEGLFAPIQHTDIVVYYGVAWLIPAISLALSAASTWYGQDQANKAQNQSDKLMKEREGSLDAWYKKQSQPFLETESGKSLQSMLMGQYGKVLEQNRNNAIAGGATAESDVAFRGKVLDSYNNTMLGASANDNNRRLATDSTYQNQISDLLGKKQGVIDSQNANTTNTLAGISALVNALGTAYGEGAFDKQPKIPQAQIPY